MIPDYPTTCAAHGNKIGECHLCAQSQLVAALRSENEALRKRNEELEQLAILAESAHDDDLAMRAEVRGFVADLYAERGQDARVAYLCNRALALLKP